MATLKTLPKVIDIEHYAGDTLSIRVDASLEFVAGRTWTAQARKNRRGDDSDIAAEFVCTPDDTGCTIQLLSANSTALAVDGVWRGQWDVQLSGEDGEDPVTTLAGGKLNLHPDVTQLP